MAKRKLVPVEGVSNIELFYDLIFVYCISVITSLCHDIEGPFLDFTTWGFYTFTFLVVLQVWFYTTLLMNRYGDRSASDNACLFINMFLLYFFASGIHPDWQESVRTINLSWALILVNLIVHWTIKRLHYDNIDDTDRKIMDHTITMLALQLVLVVVGAFLPLHAAAIISWVAFLLGALLLRNRSLFRLKPARFAHIAERCSLLTIIAFGEMIVAISSYMTMTSSLIFPVFVFAMVVGLFLIYMFEHDNMVDHHKETDGMEYLAITSWTILIIGNLTVALEYMPMQEVAFVPKSAYLTVCLVAYLLTSFMIGKYNKPTFRYSSVYVAGRIGMCGFIVLIALYTQFDPIVNLVCDTFSVYILLWHEWILYHGRLHTAAFGHSLGADDEDE